MTGRIHSFQSLGTVDGPGVRCVVFMQGCPLRCICCHNPDTWDFSGGEEVESDALVKKILRFSPYISGKGGVTVSGGEPLMQAKFVTDLFVKLRQAGIHTALDTSGCIFNNDVARLLEHTDLVLLDHKYADKASYKENTGADIEAVERFLTELDKRNIDTWFRRVIIPGKSDDEATIKQLNELAQSFPCVKKIELLPFRKLCIEKYEALGIPFPLADTPTPDQAQMDALNVLIDEKFR